MYIFLALFFLSLILMIGMVGRKVMYVRNGKAFPKDEIEPVVPDLPVIKNFAIKGTKTTGYIFIVVVLRLYVQASNFIKSQYAIIRKAAIDTARKYRKEEVGEREKKGEKFLKAVTEYKRRIKKLKYQIAKEEER